MTPHNAGRKGLGMWWFYCFVSLAGAAVIIKAMVTGQDVVPPMTMTLIAIVGMDLCDLKRKG